MEPTTCNVEGCERPHRARGYCEGHYLRWRRNGDPGPATFRTTDSSRTCRMEGCGRPYRGNGLCNAHYQQQKTGKALGPIRRSKGSTLERDDQGRKWCPLGSHWTETGAFASDTSTADGLGRRCTPCMTLRKFGVSRGQYRDLLSKQGGGCAICGGTNANGNALAVDHDHNCCAGKRSCGKCVRGLLCGVCNTGLGMFRDNPQRLRTAADYLTTFRASQ